VGVYNGEGYGRAEIDKYKSIDGRATFRPFAEGSEMGKVSISGFYQYGWYARDRPRNVAIGMASYENAHFVGTAQYLSATDNPFVAVDIERRGLSFFGEGRQGPTGWAGTAWTSSSRTRPTRATRGAASSSAARTGVRWDAVGSVWWCRSSRRLETRSCSGGGCSPRPTSSSRKSAGRTLTVRPRGP
jgi:hypothetical protein